MTKYKEPSTDVGNYEGAKQVLKSYLLKIGTMIGLQKNPAFHLSDVNWSCSLLTNQLVYNEPSIHCGFFSPPLFVIKLLQKLQFESGKQKAAA